MVARGDGIWISLICAAAAALGAACSRPVPVPPIGPHVDDEPVEVPYPPPPAVPEIIPKSSLGKDAVWIDGEHVWEGGAWVWQAGRWEKPYPDSYYARPQGLRLADGRLLWFAGAWHAAGDATKPTPRSTGTSPVRPPSPRTAEVVPLPTLPPGAEHVPDPAQPPQPAPTSSPAGTSQPAPTAPPAATSQPAPTAPPAGTTQP